MKFLDHFFLKVFGIPFGGSRNLQMVTHNTVWLFVDNAVKIGLGFTVGVWLARYLGPARFGFLSYMMAFVSIFSVFGTLGLESLVVRNIVKNPNAQNKTLGTVFCIRICGNFIGIALAIITISFLKPADNIMRLYVVLLMAGTLFQSFDIIDIFFQSQLQSKYSMLAKVVSSLFISSIKIYLILTGAALTTIIFVIFFENVVTALALLMVYSARKFSLKQWDFDPIIAKGILYDCWPLALTGLVGILYTRLDSVFIGQMLTMRDLGQFSFASMLVESLYFIPTIMMRSLSVKLYESSKGSYMREIMMAMNFACVFIIALFFILSPFLKIIFGGQYTDAFHYACWLTINIFLLGLALPRGPYLIKINRTDIYFLIDFMGLLLNVALNLIFIKMYRVYGAIFAKIATFFFVAIIANLLFRETRPIFFEQIQSLLLIRKNTVL